MGSSASNEHKPLESASSSSSLLALITSEALSKPNVAAVLPLYNAISKNRTNTSLKFMDTPRGCFGWVLSTHSAITYSYNLAYKGSIDTDVTSLEINSSSMQGHFDFREDWCFSDLSEPDAEEDVKIVSVFAFLGGNLPNRLYLKVKKP